MSKKRYRIRKAGPGEKPGVQNRTAKFLKKAQMGMEQQSMQDPMMMQQQEAMQQEAMAKQNLTKEVEELINYIQGEYQKQSSPLDIIGSLIENNIDTDLIEQAFVVLGASPQEIKPIISQVAQMKMQEINANRPPAENQDMPQPMESSEEVQEQPAQPKMSKGGYKKKLLKEAKEGRQLETETPGSTLPQPATLNNFIEGVKNEGNKFYANQMADMAYNTPQPNMFQAGGEAGYIDDKGRFVYYDEESGPKARRQERKDARRARREARRQGDSNVNYRDIYKDLGTMGADFASSLMPQIFSHRNTDFEDFSRKGTGLENSDVDVYFKKKPFGRREWSIKGLDYTSIPGYGSTIGFPGTGLGGYSTYTTRRTIPGVTVGSEMREIVNKLNDDTKETEKEREEEISAVDVKPLDDYVDPRNLSQEQLAADLEGKRLDAGIPVDEDSNLVNPFPDYNVFSPYADEILTEEQKYAREMAEKDLMGMRNTGMSDEELAAKDAEGMSRKNQLLRYLEQKEREGAKSVNLTPTFTEPEEEARKDAMNWNRFVKSYKDYMKNEDAATKDESGYTDQEREWNEDNSPKNLALDWMGTGMQEYENMSYDDFIKDQEEQAKSDTKFSSLDIDEYDGDNALSNSPYYAYRQVKMWENASEKDKNRLRRNWEKAKAYTKDPEYKKEWEERMMENWTEEEKRKRGEEERWIEIGNERRRKGKRREEEEAAMPWNKYVKSYKDYVKNQDAATANEEDWNSNNTPEEFFAKDWDSVSNTPSAYLFINPNSTYDDYIKDTKKELQRKVEPSWSFRPTGPMDYDMRNIMMWEKASKEDKNRIRENWEKAKAKMRKNKRDGGAIELLEGPFGGAVTPELYEYVYGGMEEDPDRFKDVTDPYFAPGGIFKKPKVDPALGFKSPTAEVEEYRKTVYPTSKGIFGQMKDALKEGTGYNRFTEGEGMKGFFNRLEETIAPTDFTWLSKKGDPKSAYGYIGAANLPNTIVREYGTRLGDNQDIIGSSTDLQYKDRLFRKPKLRVTDSPVDSATGEYRGFTDYFTGQPQGFLNQNKEDGQNAYGGLNKFVMAGEIDRNMFEDQNAPNLVDQTKENEFNLADCTEEELLDPTSMCYKKSITQNEYNVNKARSLQTAPLRAIGDFVATAVPAFSTMKQNIAKGADALRTADQVANTVSTDVSQGFDVVTGYKPMGDSQFNEPVAMSSARPRTFNQFAKSGGQYVPGGVYDLTPEEIDAITKAGGEIEFL